MLTCKLRLYAAIYDGGKQIAKLSLNFDAIFATELSDCEDFGIDYTEFFRKE